MKDEEKFKQAIFQGRFKELKLLTQEALDRGENPEDILNQGLIEAMNEVGIKFRSGEIYIPEVLVAAKAMHAGLEVLKPILSKCGFKRAVTIVLGTVKGDLHDIGKNLVGMVMEGAGFMVIDIGIDNDPEKFVQAIKEHKPNLVGMSALLSTTMPEMRNTIEVLERTGLRKDLKIIVGGAPVTEEFAMGIGADGYAPDATSAVEKVNALLNLE